MTKQIECLQQRAKIIFIKDCWYEQGKVEEPTKVCIDCDHFKALGYFPIKNQRDRLRSELECLKKPKPKLFETAPGEKELLELTKRIGGSSPHAYRLNFQKTTGIDIMFPNVPGCKPDPYPFPLDPYLKGDQYEAPRRLIDAIDEWNYLKLRISLDHNKTPMKLAFEKLLTIAFRELEKHKRKSFKISKRKSEDYVKLLKYKAKGLSSKQIEKKFQDVHNPHRKVRRLEREFEKLAKG